MFTLLSVLTSYDVVLVMLANFLTAKGISEDFSGTRNGYFVKQLTL